MKKLQGRPAAPGFGEGALAVCHIVSKGQEKNLQEARMECVAHIRGLSQKADQQDAEGGKILEAYEMLLEDNYLFDPIIKREGQGENLCQVLEEELDKVVAQFEQMENDYMRQRSEDIRAIKEMLLQAIKGEQKKFVYPPEAAQLILGARELTPADLMELQQEKLAGIFMEKGGNTSHTVILARNMGIPAVLGIPEQEETYAGKQVLVDGQKGIVLLEPDDHTIQEYEKQQADYKKLQQEAALAAEKPAVSKDGQSVKVCINTGSPADFQNTLDCSWDGIGLLRTEFLYTDRKSKPSIQEQRTYFQQAFNYADGRPVTIRTLDIGGDKEVAYLQMEKEENPFLGNRGIRLCLNKEDLFCMQLQALLEASEGREFSLMFPMISTVEEFRKASQLFAQVKEQVVKDGYKVSDAIRLGIMVETPAAAIMSDVFSRHVDFISVGTNDLTQYIMAADRGNAAVAQLYHVCQPAVLRMLAYIAKTGAQQKIEISVCGEAASDSSCLPLLLAMGIRKISVSPSLVGMVKYVIQNLDIQKLSEQVTAIGEMEGLDQVQQVILSKF